jgi:hypothetical protein
VTGVDFSQVALDKARRLACQWDVSVEWVAADLLDCRREPGMFNLVLIFYLQVPADQRWRVVRASAAGVAAGGTLLVVAHDRENREHGHGGPQNPRCCTPRRTSAAISAAAVCESNERVRRPGADPRPGAGRARRAPARDPCLSTRDLIAERRLGYVPDG